MSCSANHSREATPVIGDEPQRIPFTLDRSSGVTGSNVALGQGATVAAAAVGNAGATVGGTKFAFAGAVPAGAVSVGSAGNERQITAPVRYLIAPYCRESGQSLRAASQSVQLLGPQAIGRGLRGNDLFDFRRDGQVVSCQYPVQFDKHMRVSNTCWRESSCADFVQPKAAKALASKEAQTPTLEHFTLASDVLFAFGKSSLGSMLPAGKASLDKAIRRIKRHRDVTEIRVVGHTDRIGPASENEPLSLARAESVREYLVARGWDSRLVHTEGAGSREPISHCPPG